MYRYQFQEKILERHPELIETNLKLLKINQLEQLFLEYRVTLSASDYIKICAERNERAAINERINRKNFGLNQKNKSLARKLKQLSEDFLNPSKSELVQMFKNLFGNTTSADDKLLKEIRAISLDTADEIVDEIIARAELAERIAKAYHEKYER